MNDKIDLGGVETKLGEIARNLDKPFDDMNKEQRHQELVDTQKEFNKESLAKQEKLVRWTMILAIATITLCLFTMYMAYSTNQSIALQANLYSPKITGQITTDKLPWSHYTEEYAHEVGEKFWNDSDYSIPLYVEINNNGIVPFQLYNIQFESECGNGNRGLLSFPDNFTKIIGVGEMVNFNENLYFTFNTPIKEDLPCEIQFTIYGNNLVMNKKIRIVQDK